MNAGENAIPLQSKFLQDTILPTNSGVMHQGLSHSRSSANGIF